MSVSILGRPLVGALLGDDAVEALEEVDLVLGVPGDALAAVAELVHQRPERGEALVEVGIVALDHRDCGMVLPGIGSHSPRFQSLTSRACASSAGVSCMSGVSTTSFSTPSTSGATSRELLGDALVDLPVAARLPRRVHRRRQRVDEGMHVGGVEIVLLVPGGGRQHDVGVDAGGGHAEVERDQQVELAFRRLVVPDDFLRLLRAHLAQVLALHAVLRAEQVLEEILVALARGAEQVGAPDEHVARPVRRVVRVVAGQLAASPAFSASAT